MKKEIRILMFMVGIMFALIFAPLVSGQLIEAPEIVEEDINDRIFLPGDYDGNGKIQITDAIGMLSYLFQGGDAPVCQKAMGSYHNPKMMVLDVVQLHVRKMLELNSLFQDY